jgi:uncharacterized protein
MIYKLSKYCRIYEIDGDVFIYNSKNGLKSYIYDQNILKQLELLKSGASLTNQNLAPELIKYHIAVDVNENELSTVIAQSDGILNYNEEELGLIILTTRNCNFNCIYCYESHNKNKLTKNTANQLIKAVADYHKKHPLLKNISVEWFGGEPLLEKEIIYYISDELISYCEKNNLLYSSSITSNGYLLDSTTQINLLNRKVSVFQITVDGSKEIHNRNRHLKNGDGTWDVIINNLEILKMKEIPYHVRLRTNYSYDTYLSLDDFLTEMKIRFDDERFHFHFMRINAPNDKDIGIETIDTESDKSIIGMNIDSFHDHDLGLDVYTLNFSPCGGVCYARRGSVFAIDTDGTILKCTEYLDHPNNNIGTIKDGTFDLNFIQNARWLNPDPKILLEKGCYDCFDYPSCYAGTCPAAWAINKNLRCNPYYLYTDKMISNFLKRKRDKVNK